MLLSRPDSFFQNYTSWKCPKSIFLWSWNIFWKRRS